MHPITALMLSRAIEEERRRVLSPQRRWLNEVQDARAERRASWIPAIRLPGILRAARRRGVVAAARAPGPMRSGRFCCHRGMAQARDTGAGKHPGGLPRAILGG